MNDHSGDPGSQHHLLELQMTQLTDRIESESASPLSLDTLHHVAIQVEDVARAVGWYQKMFTCEIQWQDPTWALLKFENTSLALVVPGEHPPHLAFSMKDADTLGPLKTHRDGTRSLYLKDSEGNTIECMDAESV